MLRGRLKPLECNIAPRDQPPLFGRYSPRLGRTMRSVPSLAQQDRRFWWSPRAVKFHAKMEIITLILLAIVVIITVYPQLFTNQSPIPETSEKVQKISEASELDALFSSNTHVVVDFYADWCPPCRAIAPIFSKLAEEHALKGHLAFAKVNVDHVKNVAARYNVSAMPTFVFFEKGANKGVAAPGVRESRSVNLTDDGRVGRILGADRAALEAVVKALAK
ncbi:thioredoxin-like protein [Paramyrothecium foliicola]|nr:thioredoxin-like protein [Paramyrothecium foliicola]